MSAPSRCAALGIASRSGGAIATGSYVVSSGARSAPPAAMRMSTPPMRVPGWRRKRFRSRCRAETSTRLFVADPRVKESIGRVDGEIDEHERERDRQHRPLDHGVIAQVDPLERVAPYPGQAEDLLDDDSPAQQRTELQPD